LLSARGGAPALAEPYPPRGPDDAAAAPSPPERYPRRATPDLAHKPQTPWAPCSFPAALMDQAEPYPPPAPAPDHEAAPVPARAVFPPAHPTLGPEPQPTFGHPPSAFRAAYGAGRTSPARGPGHESTGCIPWTGILRAIPIWSIVWANLGGLLLTPWGPRTRPNPFFCRARPLPMNEKTLPRRAPLFPAGPTPDLATKPWATLSNLPPESRRPWTRPRRTSRAALGPCSGSFYHIPRPHFSPPGPCRPGPEPPPTWALLLQARGALDQAEPVLRDAPDHGRHPGAGPRPQSGTEEAARPRLCRSPAPWLGMPTLSSSSPSLPQNRRPIIPAIWPTRGGPSPAVLEQRHLALPRPPTRRPPDLAKGLCQPAKALRQQR